MPIRTKKKPATTQVTIADGPAVTSERKEANSHPEPDDRADAQEEDVLEGERSTEVAVGGLERSRWGRVFG